MSNSRSEIIYASSRAGRPTLEQSRNKLANTLMVARELFCKLGYRAVSMRLVAERAQISTRTLYNRYADKLSLFRACLDIGATRFPVLRPIFAVSVPGRLASQRETVSPAEPLLFGGGKVFSSRTMRSARFSHEVMMSGAIPNRRCAC